MSPGRRSLNLVLLTLFLNVPLLLLLPDMLPWLGFLAAVPAAAVWPVAVALFAWYLYCHIAPAGRAYRRLPGKLRQTAAGAELLFCAAWCSVIQLAALLWLGLASGVPKVAPVVFIESLYSAVLLEALFLNGAVRVFFASVQIGAPLRIALIALWWLPPVNVPLALAASRAAGEEARFALARQLKNEARKARQVCRTRYPILLVHGIFFRDWKALGYWGRIPGELIQNGASVYYGGQQSSASVEQSASELAGRIVELVEQTGCGKVNVIAHSKGGLDTRYALSNLGMERYVASLTTVNTPHHGCRFAAKALEKAPPRLVAAVNNGYNGAFKKLGDTNPDFLSGVAELTDEKCAALNAQMPDMPGVLYQSVGSMMRSAKSAPFPLNLGYNLIHAVGDGDNDGLVATKSMHWAHFLGIKRAPGKRGISHADMIDLFRRNIKGFDVCEFYVQHVSALREKGL